MSDRWPADLDGAGPVLVLAVGKAAPGMALAALDRLRHPPARSLVIHPPGTPGASALAARGIEAIEADHPIPTSRNLAAARRARDLAADVPSDATLLVLLSGGASALLTLPADGLALDDLALATSALLRAGAPIDELNAVRKHCEVLKGGGLLRLAAHARVRTLVLSDVVGDRLDVIGSGPTVADPTTFAGALDVLRRRGCEKASAAITARLERGCAGGLDETLKPGDAALARSHAAIIGNNDDATAAARAHLGSMGFLVERARDPITGPAHEHGAALARELRAMRPGEPRAIVLGGEPTVDVAGATGRGGRAQELALAAAIELDGVPDAAVIAFGTDGVDGPTTAAGAIATGQTAARARAAGIDPRDALRRHDSHAVFHALGDLIVTGPTGTNVGDVVAGLRR